jgi:hypothetical protein
VISRHDNDATSVGSRRHAERVSVALHDEHGDDRPGQLVQPAPFGMTRRM